jgi:EmrB/QacA subfamily drug resistance transporter
MPIAKKSLSPKATMIWIVVLTGIGGLMAALDTLVVSTALPALRQDLGASVGQLEWAVNAYNLTFAVLIIAGAAIGDRHGRRRTYAAGIALFTLASAAGALAPDATTLIAARALQGVGAAMFAPVGLALLTAAFPPERRGAAIGISGAIAGLSVASGPLVGGAIVDGLDWHGVFWINVPFGLLLVPLVFSRMRESHGPDTGIDIPGIALITGAALGIVWALVRGGAAGWSSPEVIATLVAGVVLAAGFVAWERRARSPMLPPGFFSSRAFSAGNTAVFLTFASLFAVVFFVAQLLQIVLGESPLEAGLRLLPWTGGFMIIAPMAGALADRIGERPLIAGGLALQAVGFAWLAVISSTTVTYGQLVTPLVVAGIGVSLSIPAASTAALGTLHETLLGKASGVTSLLRELGGVFGIAVAVAAFASFGGYASPAAFADGFTAAAGFAAILALIGAIAGAFVPAHSRRAAASPRTLVVPEAA